MSTSAIALRPRNNSCTSFSIRQAGHEERIQLGSEQERSHFLEHQRSLLRQLSRQLGALPVAVNLQVNQLSLEALEELAEALFDGTDVAELHRWLMLKRKED